MKNVPERDAPFYLEFMFKEKNQNFRNIINFREFPGTYEIFIFSNLSKY